MSAGQPKKFKSAKQLIELFRAFCDEIAREGYKRVPSQSGFCKWLSENYDYCDRKTIYNSLNKYFPTIKKDFEQAQSDILAEGGILGCYQPTMTIFALKNWCKWQDKPGEDKSDSSDNELPKLYEALESEE